MTSAPIADRLCDWCRSQLQTTAQPTTRFCGQRCRQSAWRLSQQLAANRQAAKPKRMAYADPPYPGLSRKYYRDEPTYAGEVDHRALIASLTDRYDGWALSTSSRTLSDVLPLCPPSARVCCWVKPNLPNQMARGIGSTWEPLIVVPGRRRRPPTRDSLFAAPELSKGALVGRKPIAFCAWLFQLLGAMPGDTLDDLFPGSGIVTRCWREHCRRLRPGTTAVAAGS